MARRSRLRGGEVAVVNATANTIPRRTANGVLRSQVPEQDGDVVTRGSVFDYRGAFPSGQIIAMTAPATGSFVTAPGDGYIVLDATTSAGSQAVALTSPTGPKSSGVQFSGPGSACYCFIPVRKEQIVYVHYYNLTNPRVTFYYARGQIQL